MRSKKALITSLLLTNFMSATPVLATNYNFTDLGRLVQYYDVNDINNGGQVIGYNNSKAFLSIDGKMQFISLGSTFSYAYGVNNSGQIVGNADTAGAFIYSNGNMQALGTLGGLVSKAYGINDSGQVVGVSATSDNSTHAFLYSNGSMQDLGTLGGTYSEATAINNRGQVVGNSATSDNSTHAFLYSNGSMQDLGTLGGSESYATSINDNSQVVGNSYYDFFNVYRHAFLYSNGSMQDLGTLGGKISHANGINNSGQVVGSSTFKEFNLSSDPSNHAFLYSNGNMADLNSFLDATTLDAGWILESAEAINDNGWIVGFAYNRITSQSHAYLLSVASVPEPETYAMFLAGLALMGFVVRRSQLS